MTVSPTGAGTNLFVTDNDIYSSGDVVSTLNNGAAGATYMHIARYGPTIQFGANVQMRSSSVGTKEMTGAGSTISLLGQGRGVLVDEGGVTPAVITR